MSTDVLPEKSLIVTDHSILRQKSRLTSYDEVMDLKLVDKIKDALLTAWTPGFGLAAIQVGIPIRAAWYRIPQMNIERLLINPVILEKSLGVVTKEGCLSLPGKWYTCQRYQRIYVRTDNLLGGGWFGGLEAQVIQHEVDHMDGILCCDRQQRTGPKVGRNEPCLCGSGKKYKKCCGV